MFDIMPTSDFPDFPRREIDEMTKEDMDLLETAPSSLYTEYALNVATEKLTVLVDPEEFK
jgi:hypothetical protein